VEAACTGSLNRGSTALHFAARKGRTYGRSFHFALFDVIAHTQMCDHSVVTETLIAAGANVEAQTRWGYTALILIARAGYE